MDKISVIVPIYKVENYLKKCINSIINQSYRNLEIILVDDGSPDNCGKICDEYAKQDKRIVVIHKENGGLSDARNKGLEIASGDYISFVDSDDWLVNNAYELTMDIMKKNDANIVSFNYTKVYENENQIAYNVKSTRTYTNENAYKLHIQGQLFPALVWNKLYKKEIIDGLLFEVNKISEDEFFTYKVMSRAINPTYLNVPLYYYLQREDSIINTISIKKLDAIDGMYERLKFTKENYPDLYNLNKYNFFHLLYQWNSYKKNMDISDAKKITSKMKFYRKKIKFTPKELSQCNLKDNMRVFVSLFW